MMKPLDPTAMTESRLSRRAFVSLGAGAFVVAALPGIPRILRRPPAVVRRRVPVMGTIAELVVVHPDESHAQTAIDAAIRELQWVDQVMSHFSATSDVGRANLTAATEAVPITTATARVLREAIRWSEASDGLFDPCLGRATALWRVGDRASPPPPADVAGLRGEGAFRDLDVDRFGGQPAVRFRSDRIAIDLGGIAKGYGVDRAVGALREAGIADALVNAGGDLYALGRSGDDGPWTVGVRDPQNPARLAATLRLEERGVATSGDYFQYFDHAGRRYHHLLDPATGEPRETPAHSVTVVAATCMTADAAATTVFGLDGERSRRLLERAGAEIVHRA